MSQRTEKVESIVRQVVAQGLLEELGPEGARITVTGVDVSPDLRHALVWLGVLADSEAQQQEIFDAVLKVKSDVQHEVAKVMTTKFVPVISFKLDSGGEYADHMEQIFKQL
jgi:ribosome-binding factor A